MTELQRFRNLLHSLSNDSAEIDREAIFAQLASIILEASGDRQDQFMRDLFVKLHPYDSLEVFDLLRETDGEITLGCRCVVEWFLAEGSRWGLGKGVGSLIKNGVIDVEDMTDELIEQLREARDERRINEISFGLWVIYCGAWMGAESNWQIVMNDVDPRTEELKGLLELDHLTDYAAGSIRKCIARYS